MTWLALCTLTPAKSESPFECLFSNIEAPAPPYIDITSAEVHSPPPPEPRIWSAVPLNKCSY